MADRSHHGTTGGDRPAEGGLEQARRGALHHGDRLHRWETLAERRIREAMEAGEYDDLPGRGRPLDLDENPFEDAAARIGHRLLRHHGYSLPWIERAHDLRAERAALRERARHPRAGAAERERLAADLAAFNRRARDHNLTVPVVGMRVAPLDPDDPAGVPDG